MIRPFSRCAGCGRAGQWSGVLEGRRFGATALGIQVIVVMSLTPGVGGGNHACGRELAALRIEIRRPVWKLLGPARPTA